MDAANLAAELESNSVPLDAEWVSTFSARVFNFLKLTDPDSARPVAVVLNALSGVCRGRGEHSQTLAQALRPAVDKHRDWCEHRLHAVAVAVLHSLAAGNDCQVVLYDVSDLAPQEWEERFMVSLFDAYEANRRSSTFFADDIAAEVGLFDRGYVSDVVTALHDEGSARRAGMEAGGRQHIQLTPQGRTRAQTILESTPIYASGPFEAGASDIQRHDQPSGLSREEESPNGPDLAASDHPLHPLYSAAGSGRYGAGRLGLIARREDERWVGLMGSWMMVPTSDHDDEATVLVDNFLLHVRYHTPGEMNEILVGLAAESPSLSIDGQEVRFERMQDRLPLSPLHEERVWGWHSQRMTWSGVSIREHLDASELFRTARKLPGATPKSFSDWNEVATWAIPQQPAADRRTVPFGVGWMSLLHFDAPTYIGLSDAGFDAERGVRVELVAHEPLDPLVLVVRDSSGRGEIGRLDGADFKPGDRDALHSATLSRSGLVPPVLVHLMVAGREIQRETLDSPAPLTSQSTPTAPDTSSTMTKDYEYDVALSFAGEDREHAEALAELLKQEGVSVFYDRYETATLWGQDLAVHLHEVYSRSARYVVMFASSAYNEKVWTNAERRAAQERALNEKGAAYILPVRIDQTNIPGLPTTTGYLGIELGVPKICEHLLSKLGRPPAGAGSPPALTQTPAASLPVARAGSQGTELLGSLGSPEPECPHCHSPGPWNGVICQNCGRKSTDLD